MASTSSAYDSESKIHPILGAGDADTTTDELTEEISPSVEEVSPLNCVQLNNM